jgi:hypothetical protein
VSIQRYQVAAAVTIKELLMEPTSERKPPPTRSVVVVMFVIALALMAVLLWNIVRAMAGANRWVCITGIFLAVVYALAVYIKYRYQRLLDPTQGKPGKKPKLHLVKK